MTKPICAIDFSAIFYQAYHASADQPLPELIQKTLKTVRFIKDKLGDYDYIVCCDSPKNWRKEVSAEYKAQREKRAPEFYDAMKRARQELSKDGLPILEYEGFEADDVIASLAGNWKRDRHEYVIASPDKDLFQLVGDDVRQLRTHDMFQADKVTLKLWDTQAVLDYLGVPPGRVADYLAICGDQSDNIKGIEGVGGKGAAALVAIYGGIEGLIAHLENPTVIAAKATFPGSFIEWDGRLSRWKTKLDAFFAKPDACEILRQNLKLTRLRTDAPIKDEDMKVSAFVSEEKQVEELNQQWEEAPIQENPQVAKDAETQPAQTALVKVDPLSEFSTELQPIGMRGVYWLARRAMASRLYATKFGSEDKAVMVMLRGKDYGLSPAAALEMLQVVEGKVCPPAQLISAMVHRHPDCEYLMPVEVTDKFAKVAAKRKGHPREFEFTYTMDMANRAGLVKKGSAWEKHPEAMLEKMATCWVSRWLFSDATIGSYSIEEMGA